MKKSSIKSIIIADAIALLLSLLMLATLTFAWFFSSFVDDRTQSINIAKFEVKFDDSGDIVDDVKQTQTIAVTAAYPRTFAQAKQAFLDGEQNVYAFEAENVGALDAMIRLSAKIVFDSNADADGTNGLYPLSGQIRFAVRTARSLDAFAADLSDFSLPLDESGNAVKGNLFTTVQSASNVSLRDYFNTLLLNETTGETVNENKRYRTKDEYLLQAAVESDGVFSGGGRIFFQLMVWLDEDAGIESTGVEIGGLPKTFQFAVVMHALQADGSAAYTHSEISADEV